ncbi:MAG: TIM barrel protein [Clostridiales bacterium]|jgi:deoxyribonuclease-4|nr:TIM barrel protein [Clostridiales bacterium]
MLRFGPAGNEKAFYDAGFKHTVEAPKYIAKLGLNAFEYSFGRGVKIKEETAKLIGAAFSEKDIKISLHAPYYINLASIEPEKQQNTINYVLQTLKAAKWFGADRIVIHPGSAGVNRNEALERAKKLFKKVIEAVDLSDCGDITMCLEVMGKMNQLGDLGEVNALCALDERVIPCVDFGHFNARTLGGLKTINDYEKILLEVKNSLGTERLQNMHIHFSRIQFTAGGEKMHWNYSDNQFGPDFEPLAILLNKYDMCGRVICESMSNMAQDAALFKKMYFEAGGRHE